MLSPILGRTRRLLCVVGRDTASLTALERARQWQRAWGCSVRVLFVVADDVRHLPAVDAVSLHRWVVAKADLDLAVRDVSVCSPSNFLHAFRRATSVRTEFVVCAAAPDAATDVSEIPPRLLWKITAQLGATLIAARPMVRPQRARVITDGGLRTVPVLELALELGDRMDMLLTYVNGLRIPASEGASHMRRVADHVSDAAWDSAATATCGRELGVSGQRTYSRATIALASAMLEAGADARADMLLVGLSHDDPRAVDDLFRVAPCTIMAVPCGLGF